MINLTTEKYIYFSIFFLISACQPTKNESQKTEIANSDPKKLAQKKAEDEAALKPLAKADAKAIADAKAKADAKALADAKAKADAKALADAKAKADLDAQAPLSLAKPKGPKVVLIATGSFNPVHRSHVGLMEKAKEALTKKGYNVIAGLISPSHDDYLKGKMKDLLAEKGILKPTKKQLDEVYSPAEDRLMLTSCAIRDEGLGQWVFVDPWESEQPGFERFTTVAWHLQKELDHQNKTKEPIEVWFVMGEDLAARTHPNPKNGLKVPGNKKTIPVIVKERKGENTGFKCEDPAKCLFIENKETEYSSTIVRKMFDELRAKPTDIRILKELENIIGRGALITTLEKGLYGLKDIYKKIEQANPLWKQNFTPCPEPAKNVLPLILGRVK